ncbi:geminin-like [Vanessa atalanta]|uniref:geminin-like n=1 Tax=Vanessa atalanta TaxID=42275 RepID=UPI001FCE2657|nr:geminin-like [Vanessa atalanta]
MSIDDSLLNLNTTEQNKNIDKSAVGNRKKNLTDYFVTRTNDPKKKMVSKLIQVSLGVCMSDDDFSVDLPSEKYWNLVAEKKRIDLKDALDENERLHKIKQSLLEKNLHYKQMLEEANSFIDVFKEVVRDTADDTGIDVADFNESIE